ncbi:MAG: hypothetical protein SF123_08400 [Chloroflexota bacterium]|nr:hypothetical protein [Chloroflexota bacterium]
MFRVTIDAFSGRPNPSWIVDNDEDAQEVLRAIAGQREIISKPDEGFDGLGYRGMHIQLFGDDSAEDFDLPTSFAFANGTGENPRQGVEIAARLIESMTRYDGIVLPEHQSTPIDESIQKLMLEQLRLYEKNPPKLLPRPPFPVFRRRRITVRDERCDQCAIELSRFNPGFWNNNSFVRQNNNCYNYARNWRTDTFAQPGRASKCYPYPMACSDVVNAALCDGLVHRCECLPDSEYPRRFVALVVAPGYDYHWYRKQIGNFWGHKPGGTPAKNTDNSSVIITNPETCNRGPYTDFCGYFYAGKSVKII